MTRDPWRVLVVGKSGSGKTYGAKSITAQIQYERKRAKLPTRLLVFTTKPKDWRVKGRVVVYTRSGLIRAMLADRFPIVVCGIFEDWPPLELPGLVCVFDEAHRLRNDARRIPRTIATFVREGRDPQTAEWIAISQRPADLAPDFKANLTHALFYPLTEAVDRTWVRQSFGIFLPATWRKIETSGGTRYAPLLWPKDFETDTPDVERAEQGPESNQRRRRT